MEPGHTLVQRANSTTPSHPSQTLLETGGAFTNIESIAVDPLGNLYVQTMSPAGNFISQTSHIYRLGRTGVVTPLALNTGFGITSRGTDLIWTTVPLSAPGSSSRAVLITQDQNRNRIATVDIATGAIGTFAPYNFQGGSFGGQISTGAGGSLAPAGHLVFSSAGAVWTSAFGGPVNFRALAGSFGGDLFIQPDGDWVDIADFGPLRKLSPVAPHPWTLSPLTVPDMFASTGRPYLFGTRAAVCPSNGQSYVSFSGEPGGSAIYRLNEPLTAFAHLLNGTFFGVQDLAVGPSSTAGMSLYVTIHNSLTGGEEVWEVSIPECAGGRIRVDIRTGNLPKSINPRSRQVLPITIPGTASFNVSQIDVASIRFGPGGATEVHGRGHYEDANGDGIQDLVLHFEVQDSGLASGQTEACLTGSLIGGGSIVGCDAVNVQ